MAGYSCRTGVSQKRQIWGGVRQKETGEVVETAEIRRFPCQFPAIVL